MAKHISRGWAKPDDPIYKTGFVIGGKKLTDLVESALKDTKKDYSTGAPQSKGAAPGISPGEKGEPDKPT